MLALFPLRQTTCTDYSDWVTIRIELTKHFIRKDFPVPTEWDDT